MMTMTVGMMRMMMKMEEDLLETYDDDKWQW